MSTARFGHMQERVITTLKLMAAARAAYAESGNRVFLYTHAQLHRQNSVWLGLIQRRINDGALGPYVINDAHAPEPQWNIVIWSQQFPRYKSSEL